MKICEKNAILAFEGGTQSGLDFLQDHWDSFNRLALKRDPQAIPIVVEKTDTNGVEIFFDWDTLQRWFAAQGEPREALDEKARNFLMDIEITAQNLFGMECVRAELP